MFATRTKVLRIVTPIALAGALALTGCSTPGEPTISSVPTGNGAEFEAATEIDAAIVTEDTIMSGNDELDAQLAQFGDELRASAAPGISIINISVYTPESVGIQVWTDDEDGIVSSDQLKPILDWIAAFSPVEPIGEFVIDGWDVEGMQGEVNGAASELGVRAEFIDSDWWRVVIPGDQVSRIFD